MSLSSLKDCDIAPRDYCFLDKYLSGKNDTKATAHFVPCSTYCSFKSSHGVSEDRSQGNQVFKSLQINAETYDLCINPLLNNKC